MSSHSVQTVPLIRIYAYQEKKVPCSEWKSHEQYGRESKGAPWSKPGAALDITERQPNCQQPIPEVRDPFAAQASLPSRSTSHKALHPLVPPGPSLSTAANCCLLGQAPLYHEIASAREGTLATHAPGKLSGAFGLGAATKGPKKRLCINQFLIFIL